MKLLFLGAGSAFTVGSNNFHSNMLLINDEQKKLLIDCGSDARHALHEAGLSHRDIQDIYISHLHADHVGGLEWMGFATKFDPQCSKPHIYISHNLVHPLWNTVLAGGLRSIQSTETDISTFFDMRAVDEGGIFIWEQTLFQLIQTIHTYSGFNIQPSYGLMFTSPTQMKVLITSDTQFGVHYAMGFYDNADLIFHDCETSPHKSGVHSHYTQLKTLPASIKKKIWLYHYNPGELPDAQKDGFHGFVRKGQIFDLSNS